MAETTIKYDDEDGFKFERNEETYLVFGKITAEFIFDFYPSNDGYEWGDGSITDWDIDVLSVIDTDGNDVNLLLSKTEFKGLEEHLKSKAEDYFEQYGISEYAEAWYHREPEYEKEY